MRVIAGVHSVLAPYRYTQSEVTQAVLEFPGYENFGEPAARRAAVPIFGLGCVAGAAGVARLHDYLTAGVRFVHEAVGEALRCAQLPRECSPQLQLIVQCSESVVDAQLVRLSRRHRSEPRATRFAARDVSRCRVRHRSPRECPHGFGISVPNGFRARRRRWLGETCSGPRA
jgi:hypothetical protein